MTVRASLFALLALLLASCGTGPGAASSASTSTTSVAGTDVHFVRAMLIEHAYGIELAQIAIARSSYLDLLEFATTISATEAAEVEQMRNWLTARGLDPIDPADPGLDPGRASVSEADRASMAAVKGFDFDDVWINLMSAHQQQSIAPATTEIESGRDPILVALATSIRDSHQQQIDGLRHIYVTKG